MTTNVDSSVQYVDPSFDERILINSLLPLFDGHSGFIAGGFFKDYFSQKKHIKDIDMFFNSSENFDKAVSSFEKKYKKKYSTDNSFGFSYRPVSNIFSGTVVVDLVQRNFGTPQEIVDSFDFSATRCALIYDSDGVSSVVNNFDSKNYSVRVFENVDSSGAVFSLLYHNDFFNDVEKRLIRVKENVDASSVLFERLNRYMNYGYSVVDDSLSESVVKYVCENTNGLKNIDVDFAIDNFNKRYRRKNSRKRDNLLVIDNEEVLDKKENNFDFFVKNLNSIRNVSFIGSNHSIVNVFENSGSYENSYEIDSLLYRTLVFFSNDKYSSFKKDYQNVYQDLLSYYGVEVFVPDSFDTDFDLFNNSSVSKRDSVLPFDYVDNFSFMIVEILQTFYQYREHFSKEEFLRFYCLLFFDGFVSKKRLDVERYCSSFNRGCSIDQYLKSHGVEWFNTSINIDDSFDVMIRILDKAETDNDKVDYLRFFVDMCYENISEFPYLKEWVNAVENDVIAPDISPSLMIPLMFEK